MKLTMAKLCVPGAAKRDTAEELRSSVGLLPRTSSVKPWSVSCTERQKGEEVRWEEDRLEEDSGM